MSKDAINQSMEYEKTGQSVKRRCFLKKTYKMPLLLVMGTMISIPKDVAASGPLGEPPPPPG